MADVKKRSDESWPAMSRETQELILDVARKSVEHVLSAVPEAEWPAAEAAIVDHLRDRITEFDGRGTLKGYLEFIAFRKAIDEYRKHVARVRRFPLVLRAPGPTDGDAVHPGARAEREEALRLVLAHPSLTHTTAAMALQKMFGDDLSIRETGRQIGVPPSSVRRWFKAYRDDVRGS